MRFTRAKKKWKKATETWYSSGVQWPLRTTRIIPRETSKKTRQRQRGRPINAASSIDWKSSKKRPQSAIDILVQSSSENWTSKLHFQCSSYYRCYVIRKSLKRFPSILELFSWMHLHTIFYVMNLCKTIIPMSILIQKRLKWIRSNFFKCKPDKANKDFHLVMEWIDMIMLDILMTFGLDSSDQPFLQPKKQQVTRCQILLTNTSTQIPHSTSFFLINLLTKKRHKPTTPQCI